MRKINAGVTSRAKRALGVAAVAGAAGLSLSPGLALAADESAAAITAGDEISGLDVYGEQTAKPSSPKLTAAPLDNPQTITVVSERTIRDQNLLSLRDILTTVPGITFGAGEGGGGYGDSINLRGYSASNDITTDGLRDSAQYSRTDPFNLEQLEVTNGANSVYSGAGSLGGSVNLVSKLPRAADVTVLSGAVGTDGYGRFTVDANKLVADGVAVRLNAMVHKNDVPGRDVETYERWGVAPAVTFGLGGPTQVTLSYVHQKDENTPEYGVPYASNAYVNGPLPGVDPARYYGFRNMDTQEVQVDQLTLRFSHRFSDRLSVSNITRWLKVDQLTVVNPPQGTWCLANGFSAQPANASGTPAACTPAGSYTLSGPRGSVRDSENRQLVSQTDVNFKFETGAVSHNMVLGFSLSNESYALDSGNKQRTSAGVAPTYTPMSIANPDNVYTGPVNYFRSALSDGELNNQAIYVFDTAQLTDQWQITGGVRLEHNEGVFLNTPYTVVSGVATAGAPTRAPSDENLLSYRLGAVYKPVPNASIYLAYGNTQTPSQASVNGGCSVTTNPNCDIEPEEGEVIELGSKWDVLGGRLSLTGAVFQNERSKYKVNSAVSTVAQSLDGRSRVRGLTLGAAGQLTDRWTVIANYTYMDSKFLQSVADGVIDAQKGDPLPFTPEHSLNLWTTYMVTDQIMLGYGATYVGRAAFNRPTGSTRLFYTPEYWVHSAAATWMATDNVSVQLNVKNLTDQEYYSRIRSNNGFGWATPGDTRSATLTLHYRF